MNIILQIVIITAISGIGGTGLGGAVGALMKRDSQKIVSLLLSFAGGVMLSIVCLDLLIEALESTTGAYNVFLVCVGILVGYAVVFLLNYIIDNHARKEVTHFDSSHPTTADDLGELIHSKHYDVHKSKNSGLFIAGVVMAIAIALHNLPEGMVIGASYAKDASNIFSGSGFVMAIVIGFHNIPEGMAVSVPLISGGGNRFPAIFVTAMSGAPTIIGALIGYFVGTASPLMLTLSLSFAGGAMLYVVFGELLPEAILMWKSKMPAFAIVVGFITGLVIIYA